jgi:hypothetical protein
MSEHPQLREAIRFAEEYGFREWLEAQEDLNSLERYVASLTEENERPVNAVCDQTWRRDVQGACPVHGGDSCLVSPPGLTEENERLRDDYAKARSDQSEANYRAARYEETLRGISGSEQVWGESEKEHRDRLQRWAEGALSPIDPPLAQEETE